MAPKAITVASKAVKKKVIENAKNKQTMKKIGIDHPHKQTMRSESTVIDSQTINKSSSGDGVCHLPVSVVDHNSDHIVKPIVDNKENTDVVNCLDVAEQSQEWHSTTEKLTINENQLGKIIKPVKATTCSYKVAANDIRSLLA
jgi:hypothetical protein